jgi:hypothetical protein
MKHYKILMILVVPILACHSTNNIAPSSIGIQPLKNYILKQNVNLTDSVTYKFFSRAEDFHDMFTITKVTRSTAVVPDFNAQCVVAIILKPSERVITVDISKAEIRGKDLNVYYNITDTTSWKAVPYNAKAVAVLPRSRDVKQVNFINKNKRDKTLIVN